MASEKWTYHVHLTTEFSGGAERWLMFDLSYFVLKKRKKLLAPSACSEWLCGVPSFRLRIREYKQPNATDEHQDRTDDNKPSVSFNPLSSSLFLLP